MLEVKTLLAKVTRPVEPMPPVTVLSLEGDYEAQIHETLQYLGLADQPIDVRVLCTGRGADGRDIYSGVISLMEWRGPASVRFICYFPYLQRKVCRAAQSSWLNEYGHFSGLMVELPPRLGVPRELMEIARDLTPGS